MTDLPRGDPRHRAALCGGGGFTLLELIVVLTLIGVITACVVPIYAGSMNAVATRGARSDFISKLRFIQELSVRESREFRMCIDDENSTYWVERLAGLEDNEKVFQPVEEDYGVETRLPDYLKITRVKARKLRGSNTYFIACHPNGACDAASVTMTDGRLRGGGFTIEVAGTLGRVEVKE